MVYDCFTHILGIPKVEKTNQAPWKLLGFGLLFGEPHSLKQGMTVRPANTGEQNQQTSRKLPQNGPTLESTWLGLIAWNMPRCFGSHCYDGEGAVSFWSSEKCHHCGDMPSTSSTMLKREEGWTLLEQVEILIFLVLANGADFAKCCFLI